MYDFAKLKETDAAYFAGILDGEGTITVQARALALAKLRYHYGPRGRVVTEETQLARQPLIHELRGLNIRGVA